MLNRKAYSELDWVFIWDPDLDPSWAKNYFKEYNDTWPNLRQELPRPKAVDGKQLVGFTLRSLTKAQMARVESTQDGFHRLSTICAYGVVSWRGIMDEHGNAIAPKHTQDDLGARLTVESLEELSFFGFVDLSLLQVVAMKVLTATR